MKQLTLFVAILIVSVTCFANPSSSPLENSKLKALSTAWKSYHATTAKQPQNDINIVYGGQDISLKRNLLTSSSFA